MLLGREFPHLVPGWPAHCRGKQLMYYCVVLPLLTVQDFGMLLAKSWQLAAVCFVHGTCCSHSALVTVGVNIRDGKPYPN